MEGQINLDSYQIRHLHDLLERGSNAVEKTENPIILYRQILEEEDGSFEEIVWSLTVGYVIEQRISSGGPIPPSLHSQDVFAINEYPGRLIKKSRKRFADIVSLLERELG